MQQQADGSVTALLGLPLLGHCALLQFLSCCALILPLAQVREVRECPLRLRAGRRALRHLCRWQPLSLLPIEVETVNVSLPRRR